MNILVTSAGRRVKIIQYLKKALLKEGGKVIAADCVSTAPALYEADQFIQIPRIDAPEYLGRVKEICQAYDVNGIISLIDSELSLLAKHKQQFDELGVKLILSDYSLISMSFDKYSTFAELSKCKLPSVPTFLTVKEVKEALAKGAIAFPLIVKPRKGSASNGITKVETMKALELLFEEQDDLIAQPFLDGEEFGIDVYVDLISCKPTSMFIKKKLLMRAGETDKSIAVHDEKLRQLIFDLLDHFSFAGPIDIDCFKTNQGYFISEINPRFGGGYPHAYEAGEDFMARIVSNLKGIESIPNVKPYVEGSIMLKYADVRMVK